MDLSLDDIIQQNRRERGRGRGSSVLRGVRRGGVGRRTSGGGVSNDLNTVMFLQGRTLPDKWRHDLFQGGRVVTATSSSNKLHISNLDFGVSNADINVSSIEYHGHLLRSSFVNLVRFAGPRCTTIEAAALWVPRR